MSEKRRVSVCFIILNYKEWELTRNCIESIDFLERVHPFGHSIIVVDNGSPNHSGKILRDLYCERSDIHVIGNDKNVGFSKGNNIGYKYVREKFNPDFVISVNSDVIFVQRDFIKKLYELYEQFPFNVAGPDIYVADRYYHQNPRMSIKDYPNDQQIREMCVEWLRNAEHMEKRDLQAVIRYIKERYRQSALLKICYRLKRTLEDFRFRFSNLGIRKAYNSMVINKEFYKIQSENICLQGSCIIFDKRYIEERNFLFTPLTFMYLEEQILSLDCYLNKWKVIYFPQIRVEHLDCGSTYNNKLSFDEFCVKKSKQLRSGVESGEIYCKYLNDMLGSKDIILGEIDTSN